MKGGNTLNKYIMLKDTIYQLYSKEGRSKSYISRLLSLNRKTLTEYINNVWKFPQAKGKRHMNPSTEKFYKKNKQLIKARLDNDVPVTEIARELGCTTDKLRTVFYYDSVLKKALEDYKRRIHLKHISAVEQKKAESGREYNVEDLDGEVWRPVLGYDGYFVSNMGRVKHYIKSYDEYCSLTPQRNVQRGYYYVAIANKNLALHRVVAHSFVDGETSEKNTVNHIDGDPGNNRASNLEWMSQSANNTHSYRELGRKVVNVGVNGRKFKRIIYKDKYEFKTVAAFSRFIGKSPTQCRRYLSSPSKHNIRIIE